MIGQTSFSNLQGPNQYVLGAAGGVAYANGTLWVADSNTFNAANTAGSGLTPQDNRVLGFPTSSIPSPTADLTGLTNPACNLCTFPADLVLGQVDFNSFKAGLAQVGTSAGGSMNEPTDVATDGTRLAVADTNNNRVLLWNSIPTSNNAPPNIVLGQSNFTSGATLSPPSASSFRGPQAVWINPDGHVFVADSQNYRVLIWNHFPTSNNQPADVVLGQANFTTGTQQACNPQIKGTNYTATASELCNPASVTSDGTRVYVADLGFNRVLIWNSIPTTNGQPADVVVGQPDMTSTAPNNTGTLNGHTYSFCPNGAGLNGICQTNLNFPRFALADPVSNQLFVADGGDDRILIFSPIPTTNGAAAVAVLGQPNFTTDVVSTQASSIASTVIDNTAAVDVIPTPTALAYDGQNLYAADPTDDRVLVFTPGQTPLPSYSVLNWASEIIRQEGTVTFTVTAGGSITAGDTVTVTISGTGYTYTIVKGDTLDAIAQGVVKVINSSNSGAGDPNATATFAGAGTGSLYLASKQVNPGFDTISLAASASNTANITVGTSGTYLSSGTAATGSPGMLVEINGTNLSDASPSNPAVAALSGTIPLTLGGAQVYMSGVATPIYRAQSNQIITQVPYSFVGQNSTSVYVRTVHTDGSTTVTNATPLYVAPANPGIFSAPATAGQVRPWPATNAYHQPGNPNAVVSVDGTIKAGDTATITIAGKAYNYTIQSSDTTYTVAQALAGMINSAPDPNVTASLGGAFSRVILTALQGGAAGTGISIKASSNSGSNIALTAYTGSTCCNVTPGSLITTSNPALPGELITVTTAGLGRLTNQQSPANTASQFQITGQPYNGPQPNVAANSVSATMGGSTGEVINAGLPSGSYGMYGVQVIVPSNLTANNDTQLYIAQNAYISNTVTVAVGTGSSAPPPPSSSGSIVVHIDNPSANSTVSGTTAVAGWAVDSRAAISTIEMLVDGVPVQSAAYGSTRNDVCAAYPSYSVGCPNVGWNGMLDTTQFADGSHTLEATATDANGDRSTVGTTFVTSNYTGSNPTRIYMDQPFSQSGPFQGTAIFRGWAFNVNSPVASVQVSIDGAARGQATYGVARPDVCSAYPNEPGCPNVGWSYLIDTTTLSNGTHTFAVTVTAANGQKAISANPFTVANWTTANPLIVNIDTPNAQSAPFSGIAFFGGWAIDRESPISSVTVSIDGIPYGNAAYGGNRSDVCAIYTNVPGCPNVGWNFSVDTTLLADGTHTLQITANPASGNGFTATRQFTVGNMPPYSGTRITIDTPNQQGTTVLSGVTNIGGWAVNDYSMIATVQVSVDGTSKGFAAYGGSRPDVCATLGYRQGCPNVGWNYMLDTTTLTNGNHVLEITVTAANNQRASTSATFTVSNSAPTGPTTVSISRPGSNNNPYQGIASFSGTAASTTSHITSVSVTVDGVPYGAATPATGEFFASFASWTFLLNTVQLTDGTHTLGVTALAADGTFAVASASFQVGNWSSPDPILVDIDTPSASQTLSGFSHIGGWVVDANASISSVTIAVDGIPYGAAQYGGVRSDVCAVYPGSPGCPNVGWDAELETGFLSNGPHTLAVTGTTSAGQSSTSTVSFSVLN